MFDKMYYSKGDCMKDNLRKIAIPALAIIMVIVAIVFLIFRSNNTTKEEEYEILTERLCSVALEIVETSPHIINLDSTKVGDFKYVNFETLHAYGLMTESEDVIPMYVLNPLKTKNDESAYFSENYKIKIVTNSEKEIVCEGIVNTGNPPEITLIGGNAITITKGTPYEEPGYTAIDEEDGDITSKVIKNGIVDTENEGDYDLLYYVEDSDGNRTTRRRIVTVK